MTVAENVKELLALNERLGKTSHVVKMSLTTFLQYIAQREPSEAAAVYVPLTNPDPTPFGYCCGYPVRVIGLPGYYVEVA
jgi:hypothetical protein